mmetsp:Transcript_150570/g.288564  ORF Transcript_150570/g.288564 Transcript_150570/m.288564 type:complete len:338 (+) Transcript_150570:2059-3072(+)
MSMTFRPFTPNWKARGQVLCGKQLSRIHIRTSTLYPAPFHSLNLLRSRLKENRASFLASSATTGGCTSTRFSMPRSSLTGLPGSMVRILQLGHMNASFFSLVRRKRKRSFSKLWPQAEQTKKPTRWRLARIMAGGSLRLAFSAASALGALLAFSGAGAGPAVAAPEEASGAGPALADARAARCNAAAGASTDAVSLAPAAGAAAAPGAFCDPFTVATTSTSGAGASGVSERSCTTPEVSSPLRFAAIFSRIIARRASASASARLTAAFSRIASRRDLFSCSRCIAAAVRLRPAAFSGSLAVSSGSGPSGPSGFCGAGSGPCTFFSFSNFRLISSKAS